MSKGLSNMVSLNTSDRNEKLDAGRSKEIDVAYYNTCIV